MTFAYRVEQVDTVKHTLGVIIAHLVPVKDRPHKGRFPGDVGLRTYDPALVEQLKVGAVVTLSIEDPR